MNQEGKGELMEGRGLVFEVAEPIKGKLKPLPGVGLPGGDAEKIIFPGLAKSQVVIST